MVKRAIGRSEAGAERRPGNRVSDDFFALMHLYTDSATNIERIAAVRYNLIISESPETKIIDLL